MPAKLDEEIQRLNLVAPTSWVKKIDDWRRREPDLPNLSEAIRRLVEMGLESAASANRVERCWWSAGSLCLARSGLPVHRRPARAFRLM
jgi:hypothetical protein